MVAVVSVFATVLAGELALHGGTGRAVHFADAGDEAAVARGPPFTKVTAQPVTAPNSRASRAGR